MGAVSSGVLGTVIGIVGSLVGAPLVAQLNNSHSDKKDLMANRRARIAEWGSALNLSVGPNNIGDFRTMPNYGALSSELPDELIQRIDSHFRNMQYQGALDVNHQFRAVGREILRDVQAQVALIEKKWGLL